MRRRLLLTIAALFALAAMPSAALAQEGPIVLEAPYRPYHYIVPATTDPNPSPNAVMGASVLRGTVLHGEGDLLLLDLGGDAAVVRLPDTRLPGESVALGSLVEAAGIPTAAGILESLRVVIWMQ